MRGLQTIIMHLVLEFMVKNRHTLRLAQFLDSPDGSEAWWSSRDSAHPLFVRESERVCT